MDISSAATLIQSYYRGFSTRKNLQQQKKAATKIQSNFRGYKARKQISTDMETGAIGTKKKKKKGKVKYVWNKMKHCWTKMTGRATADEHKRPEEPQMDNELWELSQKPGEKVESEESEDEVDGYKIPHGKSLTLLQLNAIYEKKKKTEPEDTLKEDPLIKYGAPQKSPYPSAYDPDAVPYIEPSEPELPKKPHKVIKYVAKEPVKKQEEEQGFFSMFKKKEAPEGAPKEESILDQMGDMGGKFMGLFQAKPAEETKKPAEEVKKPAEEAQKPAEEVKKSAEEATTTTQEGKIEKEEKKAEQGAKPEANTPPQAQGVGEKFMGLFGVKAAAQPAPPKPEEPKPEVKKPEVTPQEEEGFFGKIGGLFKPKTEPAKPVANESGTSDKEPLLKQDKEKEPKTDTAENKPAGRDPENDDYDEVDLATDEEETVDDAYDKDDDDVDDLDKDRYDRDDYDDNDDDDDDNYENDDYSDRENNSRNEYSEDEDEDRYSDEDEDEDRYSDEDDHPSYDDDDEDTPEPASKTEFQQKFMTFLKKDAAMASEAPKVDETPKPKSNHQEESGVDKMFGMFKKKT